MPQHLADLAERSALAQHLSGESVAKLMCSSCWGINARTLECMPNDRSNTAGTLKASDGSLRTHKHATTGAVRSPMLQIVGNSLADFRRKG